MGRPSDEGETDVTTNNVRGNPESVVSLEHRVY